MSFTALLVFARCAGFVSRAPGISHPSVPHALRGGLAIFLTLAVVQGVPAARDAGGVLLLLPLVLEVLIGAAIGLGASLLYDGAYAGGRMLDDYVGVKAIAPSVDIVAPSGYGRIWSTAFTAGFFLLGAYRPVLVAFARSFEQIPPGVPFDPHGWAAFAATLASSIVLAAIAVAAPAVALAFVTQAALAALSRAVPRFATFGLSFPLVFGAVLLVTAAFVPLAAANAAHPILVMPQ